VIDEPSFFHQWQSDGLLEQYTEQQIAVAFGQGEVEVDRALAAALMPLQQPTAAAAERRPRKAAKVNTSWDSCITEQGSPADSSSLTILSFGGHAFAKAETHQLPSAPYGGAPATPPAAHLPAAPRNRRASSTHPRAGRVPPAGSGEENGRGRKGKGSERRRSWVWTGNDNDVVGPTHMNQFSTLE